MWPFRSLKVNTSAIQPRRSLSSLATSVGGGALAIYSSLLALLLYYQRTLIFPGTLNGPENPAITGGKLIKARDGTVGLFFPPKDSSRRTLFYFHGNGDQLGWGPAYIGAQIAQEGLGFLAVEYPGFGVAPGRPSQQALIDAASSLANHLAEELNVPQKDIVLFGQSIGCVPALALAEKGIGSKAILVSPFTSVPEMAMAVYPALLWPVKWLLPSLILDPCDNVANAENVKMPTLVIHGTTDEIVPYSHGERIHAVLKQQNPSTSQFIPVPGAGHNDILNGAQTMATLVRYAEE